MDNSKGAITPEMYPHVHLHGVITRVEAHVGPMRRLLSISFPVHLVVGSHRANETASSRRAEGHFYLSEHSRNASTCPSP
jgi:hypothetical protein